MMGTLPSESGAAGGGRYLILVVEDSVVDAMVVRERLERDGRFTVTHVATLAETLQRLSQGALPDAVILDLNLSDSSGLETFCQIHDPFPSQPIIILTGEHDESLGIKAMRLGAQDYVGKSHLDGQVLVRSLLYAIERNKRRMVEHRQRAVDRELQFAKQIQEYLLPNDSPKIPGFDVAGRCVAIDSTSGDFFDFIDHGDGKWDIVLADVCGHGIGPAMITVGTRRLLRSTAELYENVGQLVTIANRGICEDTFQSLFVTLFFARLDSNAMRLTYVGAGHLGFLIDSDGEVVELSTRGIPTGVDPDYTYQVDGSVELSDGRIVLLMTDGIWEARGDDHVPFGKERAADVVHRNRSKPASEIVAELISSVTLYCHPHPIKDDMTAVVIKSL
ncbi:SpoIIE family protein phosphatase [Stieleria sp. ICT_E10.1]|uniref:PP2C family protein-serine/threonine phosphatase n=1 Tax=Stieleria sedimenti TaxID=2976331 RepID=UPI00217FE0EE|nr:SpoIIE family protein phosphatase [Stieleria sedimenti]MCS7470673.1 SpoIIE family protein phosphatase [Stieleria sedimenti]